jgi:hypothetical protein
MMRQEERRLMTTLEKAVASDELNLRRYLGNFEELMKAGSLWECVDREPTGRREGLRETLEVEDIARVEEDTEDGLGILIGRRPLHEGDRVLIKHARDGTCCDLGDA